MDEQRNKQEIAHLERVNEELTSSLKRCRQLLFECRSKLVANANDKPDEQEPESRLG